MNFSGCIVFKRKKYPIIRLHGVEVQVRKYEMKDYGPDPETLRVNKKQLTEGQPKTSFPRSLPLTLFSSSSTHYKI